MKRMLRRGAALLLCLAALIVTASAATRETVYFMAVNDTPLELNAATMPTRAGGVLYVPYTMFSANATGVNLGVFAAYNSARGQVLVYSNRKQLVFDLVENTAHDIDGNTYTTGAMVRGSTVYLPVALVCSVFSDQIWYSLTTTRYGMLVRVKNSSVILDDRSFIDAADSRMSGMLAHYLQEAPSAAPTPSRTPSPPDPTPTPSQAPSGHGAGVYLAFAVTSGDSDAALNSVLDALSREDVRGMFFFDPAEIAARDDLVRRLIGSGHLVGARLTGEDLPTALAELEQARNGMAAVAKCRLPAVLAGELEDGDLEELALAGCVCWQTTVDGRDLEGTSAQRAAELIRRLTPGEDAVNYLLLDAGAGGTLRPVLEELTEADFRIGVPVPTEL